MGLLFLIGFMGSGKSKLAKKSAKRCNVEWIDSDLTIENQQGVSIPVLFEKYGEPYFRILEKKFIQELDTSKNAIISVGGGLPCFNNLIELLKEKGIVIYLNRSPKELYQRLIKAKKERPLLASIGNDNLLEFIENLIKQREDYYLMANHVLNRDEQLVETIATIFKK